MVNKIDLSGEYRLYTFDSGNAPLMPDTLESADNEKQPLTAQVPGNVELDYMRAGLFPDLYFGDNILRTKGLENKDFWYEKTFEVDFPNVFGARLVFEGVDTIAEYFLNGVKIGQSDNALIPHSFDITNVLIEGQNTLAVHIFSAVQAAEKYEISPYNVAFPNTYESLNIRKSAASYGWDILPRALSAGIWRDVFIEFNAETEIKDVYLSTCRVEKDTAILICSVNAKIPQKLRDMCTLKITGECKGHKFVKEAPLLFNAATVYPYVEHPLLWYPQGMGEQNLYDVRIEIIAFGRAIARKTLKYGIRKVDVKCTEEIGEEGDFAIFVNGEKCRIRGIDHTPIDVFHSKDAKKTREVVENIAELNANLVRIWGGGVYENDEFYDLCDEKGILVWQDIMLACHAYPQTAEFLEKMTAEVKAAAKRLRNHSCLALWCGSNETDWAYVCVGLDPNDDKLTRKAIKDALYESDPFRYYLPSTPYFSREFVKERGGKFYLDLAEIEEARVPLAEEHYWWHRDDFKSFTKQSHKFIAEIGYGGSAEKASVDKFLKKGYTFDDDAAWSCHSFPTESKRDTGINYLFDGVLDDTAEKIAASMDYQAEAYRYIVEKSRTNENTNGIMLWNLRDGFPIFSSAIVDYYGRKKLAYYAVRAAYEPLQVFIDGETGEITLVNDSTYQGEISVKVQTGKGALLLEKTFVIKQGVQKIGTFDKKINKNSEWVKTEIAYPGKTIESKVYVYSGKINYSDYRGGKGER